jgi:hypothetical protein
MDDVRDVEGFVWEVIRRKMPMVQPNEMEDLVSEGLLIMATLHNRYDPAKDVTSDPSHVCRGKKCCVPSFAGYANFILPKKMMEVYYARQPEFQVRTVEGKRTYVRYASAHSLDERNSRSNHGPHDEGTEYRVEDFHSTRHVNNFIPVPIVPRGDRRS